MTDRSYALWDLPTRVCHWLIAVCVPLAWWSAETERHELHQWLGYTVIVLVASRIAWGFLGSRHSRFGDFLVGPGRVLAYLRGRGDSGAGHNPLGGWSVLALLALLLVQAVSGLFNSDDVFFSGPLYHGAGSRLRGLMGTVHDSAFYLLLALVALHIMAVLYHQFRLREPLVQAMLRGSAAGRSGREAPVSPWRAVVIVAAMALLLWAVLAIAPAPPPVMW